MTLDIKESIPLAPLTTFNIGGNAKFFAEVGSVDELAEATKFAKDNKLAVFVLGGGSNILVSDDGFDGLVIKNEIKGIERKDTTDEVILTVGAGEMWDYVVARAVELNASGIENLSLIPGTVGGAVYQNIGAYGAEIKNVIESVKVYNTATGNIVQLSSKHCNFKYRSSVFKKNKNLIILGAELLLSKDHMPNLSHPDLNKRFTGTSPTTSEIRQAVIEIRRSKLPYPDEVSNAGSFFKNPVIPLPTFHPLLSSFSDLRGQDLGNGFVKLSAAQLIEKAGWKGKRIENVGVADKHALVLVNYGSGTAQELVDLENKIIRSVLDSFSIKLEPEVEKVA